MLSTVWIILASGGLQDHQQDRRFGVGHPGVAYCPAPNPRRWRHLPAASPRRHFDSGRSAADSRRRSSAHRWSAPASGARCPPAPLRFAHVGVADGGAHPRPATRPGWNSACGLRSTRTAGRSCRRRLDMRPRRRSARWSAPGWVEAKSSQLTLGVGVRGQRQDHDRRIRRIGFAIGRPAGHSARQQLCGGVDRRLNVARRAVDIAVEVNSENDAWYSRASWRRSSQVTAAIRPRSAPARVAHRRGHGLRRGSRQRGANHDHREVHLRQRGYRQQPEAENAAQG